jgi:hypothetical protein
MPDDAGMKLAWQIHELVFVGQNARDEVLLKRLREGGEAVARYLGECESAEEKWEQSPRICKTAQRLMRKGYSRRLADIYMSRELPPSPDDPLDALGRTDDPTLSAGIVAAFHDFELHGSVGADMQPVRRIVPFGGRKQAVHNWGRSQGTTFKEAPDSFTHIFGAFFGDACTKQRDLINLLRVRQHLKRLRAGLTSADAPNDGPAPAAASAAPESLTAPTVDDESHCSPTKLAEVFGIPADALRSRLNRWRRTHHDGWVEVTDRGPREAKYLYRVGSVRHIIESLRATSETTGERPAK